EAAATATQRPEQIRLIVGIDADQLATCGDELDCPHPITGEAMLATVEAQATPKCVADYADARRRAVQGSEAQLRSPRHKVTPECPRTAPRSAGVGIDLNAAEARGAQQHGVGKRTERRCKVPGALGRDMLAIGRRRTDDLSHIIRSLWH